MEDIRQIVDDPEWQALRRSLMGTWKKSPASSAARLAAYLGDGSDPRKARRVLNYLTGSVFRLGAVGCPEADRLRDFCRSLPRA